MVPMSWWIFACAIAATTDVVVSGFSLIPTTTPLPTPQPWGRQRVDTKHWRMTSRFFMTEKDDADADADADDWISLDEQDPTAVRKRILEPGQGGVVSPGSEVEIEYEGTLAIRDWNAHDVVTCWLSQQQGLEALAPAFLEHDITIDKLVDTDTFLTPDFVTSTLGLSNKIQGKKLIMAAKRLTTNNDYEVGRVFDSSAQRQATYQFTLGSGKAIRAMDLAVSTMQQGERAQIVARADYAYGKDGLRRSNGDVVVPPFATLAFEVQLL